ncbi:MAG: PQQ-dependent sugar dehydrogenase [Cyanobacteria bacterium P01_A01_bin.135]
MFSINRRPATKKACCLILAGSAIAILGAASCTTQAPPAASTAEEPVTAQENPTPPSPTAIEADPEVQAATVIDGLANPWGMVWLPNGDMLITERPGRLRLVQDGALVPEPVAGLPDDILTENQGGLLDIALHPEFETSRLVYFTYSHGTLSANRTRVARATFDGTALSDWDVIFEVDQTKSRGQHFGSRLAWLPDGTLLASIGDGGNPPIELEGELIRQQAQNIGSHLGKVVRINDDGSAPNDNPFVSDASAAPEVWSYGHRNIQGLAVDSATGQVWATEHGSRGGDEVNQINGGENHGWPVATHSREYSGGLISPEQSLPGMVDPIVVWTPSIAPSGLEVYRGDRFPGWQGDLFAGGLVSQDIRRIEVDESGRLVSEVPIPIGQRVRDIQQGPDGLLYVLTDEANGQLIRLEPVGG